MAVVAATDTIESDWIGPIDIIHSKSPGTSGAFLLVVFTLHSSATA
jgi:hypothetical protein